MLLPIACRLLMTVDHGDMQNNTGLNGSSTAQTPSSTRHSHGRLLTGLLIALNILLIICIYLCFYKYFFSSNPTATATAAATTATPDSSPPSSPRPALARSLPLHIIGSIPSVEFNSDTVAEKPDCAVCLTEFKDGERLRILPRCAHQFHVDCIDKWFQLHADCPLCRTPADRSGDQG